MNFEYAIKPIAPDINSLNTAKAEGKSVIVTSHRMSEVEEIADKVMYLQEGTIGFYKTIRDLKSETALS